MGQIKIGDYLFRRLKQLGIESIFGVPGDYELATLDLVEPNGLKWRGNPNELVASYAADGYARIKGTAAFVTTFGPGELSAYCGMAGHFCEFLPVLHIVGYPTRQEAQEHRIMHHSVGDGRYGMYEEMSKQVTAATAVLWNPSTAVSEIDRVLNTMFHQSRPGYIGIPVDVGQLPCSDEGLKTHIVTSLPPNDDNVERQVVEEIVARLNHASNPVVVVDGLSKAEFVLDEVRDLIAATQFPTFTTAMGKGASDETLPTFGGVYAGIGTDPNVKKAIESADILLWIGRYSADFNTGGFTEHVHEEGVVNFQRFWVSMGPTRYELHMKQLLNALIAAIKQRPLACSAKQVSWNPFPIDLPPKGKLTQDFLWTAMGKFFQPGDMIIGETGTAGYGLGASKFPKDTYYITQTVFGSIGYATGAAVGAFQTLKEGSKYKRGVLVTGEGSFHLTAQAVADMLRRELNPIVFILENSGYTVERMIHGETAEYNSVAIWDYSLVAKTFGPHYPSKYHGPITTCEQLNSLLEGGTLREECFHLVELKLEPMDLPFSVKHTREAVLK